MAKAARLLLYALLVWAPLPLASNRAIVWAVNGALATLILTLFLLGEYAAKTVREVEWGPAAWTLAGVTAWAGWIVFQALPITPQALHHSIWSSPGADIPDTRGAISINPASTWATIAEFVPIVLLGLVSFRLAQDRHRARTLLMIVVGATVLVAVLGLVSFAAGVSLVSWFDTPHYQGYLTATFVGRSAAASYFAIGMVAAAALVAERIEERRAGVEGHHHIAKGTVLLALSDSVVWVVAFLILLLALLETGSRGGVISAAIGLLVVVAVSVPSARFTFRARAGAGALAVLAFGALLWTLGGRLFERLGEGIGDQDRLMVYRETIDMILSRPVLGQGAGTFGDVYPLFQGPGEHNLVWLRAHSTYLQAAAELGLPVFAVAIATILFVLAVIARQVARRVAPTPAAIAALGAAAGLAVQSAIDFSIQIQAVALTMVVLLGAGLGESVRRPLRVEGDGDDAPRPEAIPSAPPRFERVSVTIPTARNASAAMTEAGVVPDGMRLYVFGDVHGRFDLLSRLREAILRDRDRSPPAAVQVIGLGDFIDRGPDSKRVVESLMSDFFECSASYIRGNHEQMLLDFLDDPENGPVWLRNGGVETLRSYSIDVADFTTNTRVVYAALLTAFKDRLPAGDATFLGSLPLSHVVGGYFFAHAGARPGVPLHLQKPSDLLWIRGGFADRDAEFERIVVHGHTPVEEPYLGKYRINLDTGAYLTNRLSCLVLETRERRILEF